MIQVANTSIKTTPATTTAAAAAGCFSARKPRPTTKMSSLMLRIQLLNGSGLALATARVPALPKCDPAASVPPRSADKPLDRRAGVTKRRDRDQRAADGPDDRVDRVPDRVDPRDLVGDELDDVQHDRRANDDVVVEDLELLAAARPSRTGCARPRIATVAYRLIPAANENPIVRPSVVRTSTLPVYHSFQLSADS